VGEERDGQPAEDVPDPHVAAEELEREIARVAGTALRGRGAGTSVRL